MARAMSVVVSSGNCTSNLWDEKKFEMESIARSNKRPVFPDASAGKDATISFSDKALPTRDEYDGFLKKYLFFSYEKFFFFFFRIISLFVLIICN